jgi:hypothetical protein
MADKSNKKNGVSIWFLYIGIFLCCSGIGVVVGAIFIAYWGIKTLEGAKQGNSYTENNTENNFTANIDHYHASNDGSDTGNWRRSGVANEDVSRDFVSKDTLEENR